MMTDKFDMVAKTFLGLEGVLADELRALGAEDVTEGNRVVSFTGDKETLYRANFACRTAVRVLKPFLKLRSTSADDLYEQLKSFDWEQLMTVKTTFAIDATVYSEDFNNSRFVTYRVKDAIADFFNEKYGQRPSIRLTNPDIRLDVHISGRDVTLSLDSSGDPLFKRGWRVAQTDAPINEVLAAGIILLSGWKGETDLIDPMCGSGTFLIEAALIAANIAPGVYRDNYAFQQWPDYDADLFDKIYNDDSGEREFTHKIYGSDIEGKAIAIARANVKNAGLNKYIELERKDFNEIEEVPAGGTLISNPPYGERLNVEDIESLYRDLGFKFKHTFQGYNVWLICYNEELYYKVGLNTSSLTAATTRCASAASTYATKASAPVSAARATTTRWDRVNVRTAPVAMTSAEVTTAAHDVMMTVVHDVPKTTAGMKTPPSATRNASAVLTWPVTAA